MIQTKLFSDLYLAFFLDISTNRSFRACYFIAKIIAIEYTLRTKMH